MGIGVLLHTQVTLETPYLVTVRRSIREDVFKMESTLLTLTVQTRNHSKFIATTNTPSSREEWMDPRISIEVGQTMFRASVQSGESSGWDWRRSTVSLQELPELTRESTWLISEEIIIWLISEEIRNTPTTTSLWSGMLLVSTSYKLQVTGELQGDSILYGSGGYNINIYIYFAVESERAKYKLHLGAYTGTAGDGMRGTCGAHADGMPFSTPDSNSYCAQFWWSGWWYRRCFCAHLNNAYSNGFRWERFTLHLGLNLITNS